MVISVTGKEQCDILYYIVKVALKLRMKVAVFDNSITHDFFNIYKTDDKEDIVKKETLTVFKDYQYSREYDKEGYDYIYIYDGLYPTYKGYEDLSIIAPSYAGAEWEMVKPQIFKNKTNDTKTILLLRDKVNRKFSDYAVLKKMEFDPTYVVSMEFDAKDYSAYICLTHNKKSKLRRNGELREVIINVCEEIYGINAKTLKRYV